MATGAIFLNCAGSRTQGHVMAALARRGVGFRAFGRGLDTARLAGLGATACTEADLIDEPALLSALRGAEVMVHVAPALQDRETAMGQLAIDAARRAGVRRFVQISVLNPQISHLMNHKAKLDIEDYLISSGLEYVILRPTHYFQNLDIPGTLASGRLRITYDVETPLSFVDMADVGEVAAMVATDTSEHGWASYDLCSADCLSGTEIAARLAQIGGQNIAAERIALPEIVAMLTPILAGSTGARNWTASAIERLFLYYSRFGLRGNAQVLRWLLGREPNRLGDYAQREISAAPRQ